MRQSDVCILGAGPCGASTAIRLASMGHKCTLIDKDQFPRDKVCGDAVTTKALHWLYRLDLNVYKRIIESPLILRSSGFRYLTPDNTELKYTDEKNAVAGIIKRYYFDSLLIEKVKACPLIDFQENILITDYQRLSNGWIISNHDHSYTEQTKLLIDASGANSNFTRKVLNIKKNLKHYGIAVRTYYRNIKAIDRTNYSIELISIKGMPLGYFWIFPLGTNIANVGLGFHSDFLKKKNMNLRKKFYELIATDPKLSPRFEFAEQLGKLDGFGLRLGSKRYPLCGSNYLIAGDAAHLVNPLTGEGISYAIQSGMYAGEQAARAIESKNYTQPFLAEYERKIDEEIQVPLKKSKRLFKYIKYPFLLNSLVKFVNFCNKFRKKKIGFTK